MIHCTEYKWRNHAKIVVRYEISIVSFSNINIINTFLVRAFPFTKNDSQFNLFLYCLLSTFIKLDNDLLSNKTRAWNRTKPFPTFLAVETVIVSIALRLISKQIAVAHWICVVSADLMFDCWRKHMLRICFCKYSQTRTVRSAAIFQRQTRTHSLCAKSSVIEGWLTLKADARRSAALKCSLLRIKLEKLTCGLRFGRPLWSCSSY